MAETLHVMVHAVQSCGIVEKTGMELLVTLAQIIIALSGSGLWIIGLVYVIGGNNRRLRGLFVLYTCASIRIAISIAYIAVFRLTELYLLLAADRTAGLWITNGMLILGKAADCTFLITASIMAHRRTGTRGTAVLVWASGAWAVASAAVSIIGVLSPVPRALNAALNGLFFLILAGIAAEARFYPGTKNGVNALIRQAAGTALFAYLPLRFGVTLADAITSGGISSLYFVSIDLLFYFALNLRVYVFLAQAYRGRREAPDVREFCRALGFSTRERQIAELLLQDRAYKDIAASLFISLDTVKSHAKSIYRKAERKDRRDLIALYRGGSPQNHPLDSAGSPRGVILLPASAGDNAGQIGE
jgi:DNA-binding CsgD family transcriptional regulator